MACPSPKLLLLDSARWAERALLYGPNGVSVYSRALAASVRPPAGLFGHGGAGGTGGAGLAGANRGQSHARPRGQHRGQPGRCVRHR